MQLIGLFNYKSIFFKIVVGCLFIATALLGALVYNYDLTNKMTNLSKLSKLAALQPHLFSSILNESENLVNLVNQQGEEDIFSLQLRITNKINMFEKVLQAFTKGSGGLAIKPYIIKENIDNINDTQKDLNGFKGFLDIINKKNLEEDTYNMLRRMKVYAVNIIDNAKKIENNYENEITNFPEKVDNFQRWLFVIIAISIGIIIALTYVIIIKPINYLYVSAGEISSGNTDIRSKLKRSDEIGQLSDSLNYMLDRLKVTQDELLLKEKQQQEMEIAKRIQTSLLPATPDVKLYDIAATMIPADEVGGDYYDFLEGKDGRLWFGIGDVTGHGLTAGLVMMMTQSIVTSIIKQNHLISPQELIIILNYVMHENIRRRLKYTDHMTLSVLVDNGNGKFEFSGAHEDIIIYRASTGKTEQIHTEGAWVGILPDISHVTSKAKFSLHEGDVMLLYTDGLIEAKNHDGQQYDIERLMTSLVNYHTLDAEDIKNKMINDVLTWLDKQLDDITLIVVKRNAPYTHPIDLATATVVKTNTGSQLNA